MTFPKPKHSPSFKPLWKKPALSRLVKSWPPKGYARKQEVDGFDLWSLAKKYGRKNPWDLVIFNFQTDDPRETNWYLHHFVGCWQSDDDMNFTFDYAKTTTGPGVMYIPPPHWVPDPKFERGSGAGKFVYSLVESAVSILKRCAAGFPTLHHGNITMTAHHFDVVAELINTSQVDIDIDPDIGWYNAHYFPLDRTITLGRPPRIRSTYMHGVLANEATHVAAHRRSLTVDRFKEEMMSSFVQSVVSAKRSRLWVEKKMKDTGENFDELFFPGWVLRTEFPRASFVSLSDLDGPYYHPTHKADRNPFKMLKDYMMRIPTYKKKKGTSWTYTWKEY